jgi:hypothetical protein
MSWSLTEEFMPLLAKHHGLVPAVMHLLEEKQP